MVRSTAIRSMIRPTLPVQQAAFRPTQVALARPTPQFQPHLGRISSESAQKWVCQEQRALNTVVPVWRGEKHGYLQEHLFWTQRLNRKQANQSRQISNDLARAREDGQCGLAED